MTRKDELTERLETYLDEYEGVTPLPDVIRHAVRAELPKRRQARPRIGLARFTIMSNSMRIGLAAVFLAIAALVGYSLYGNNVGTPSGTETPSASPTAAPSSDAALPVGLQHTYFGPSREIPGAVPGTGAALLISDSEFEFITNLGKLFTAHATLAAPGQLQLSSMASADCQMDDVGTYPYTLSPGGSVLTISEGTDGCAARGAAVPGDWFTARCKNPAPDDECLGDLDPGMYGSHYFEPLNPHWWWRFGALTYTVPEGWANYADGIDVFGLTPQTDYAAFDGSECYDCLGTRDTITLVSDPGAANEDCLDENVPGVGFTADELFAWISGHRGFIVSGVEEGTIDGRAATSFTLDAAADWTGVCPGETIASVPLFYRPDSSHWALPVGDTLRVTLIDLGGGHTTAVIVDTANVADLDAFVQEAMPIIETFAFAEG